MLRIHVFQDVAVSVGESLLHVLKKTECLYLQQSSSSKYRNILLLFLDSEFKTLHSFQTSGTPHPVPHHIPASSVFTFSIYLKYRTRRDWEITTKTWEQPRQEAGTSRIKGRNTNHLTLKYGYCSWKLRSLYAFAYISILSTPRVTVTL
jgi:hypothetical protein